MKCFSVLIDLGMLSIGGRYYECHKSARQGEGSEILRQPHESIAGRRSEPA